MPTVRTEQVTVALVDGTLHDYRGCALTWQVDDVFQLHLWSGDGATSVASYAAGTWRWVQRADQPGQ